MMDPERSLDMWGWFISPSTHCWGWFIFPSPSFFDTALILGMCRGWPNGILPGSCVFFFRGIFTNQSPVHFSGLCRDSCYWQAPTISLHLSVWIPRDHRLQSGYTSNNLQLQLFHVPIIVLLLFVIGSRSVHHADLLIELLPRSLVQWWPSSRDRPSNHTLEHVPPATDDVEDALSIRYSSTWDASSSKVQRAPEEAGCRSDYLPGEHILHGQVALLLPERW